MSDIDLVESTERILRYRARVGDETYDVLIESTDMGRAPWIVLPPQRKPFVLLMTREGAEQEFVGYFDSREDALQEAAARLGVSLGGTETAPFLPEARPPLDDLRSHQSP